MDGTAIVVSIASSVVAIAVAVVSAVASDRASTRSARATEAAAARIERAERDTRALGARADLRERRASAYRQLIELSQPWLDDGAWDREDEEDYALRRYALLGAFADVLMWAEPVSVPTVRALQSAFMLGTLPPDLQEEYAKVSKGRRDALIAVAHRDLMATYPTTPTPTP